ncbi:recombination protein RecO [Campylobacter majalis]|uniref:recombination protein RecO n=1 Tax=Campylobacter majalis TaxID=2790656 RepID=UPI003D694228
MQGYILRIQKVKDEDLIVYILTNEHVVKSYRFYGARHAVIMMGYKIDFELISNTQFLPHLRNILHLGFSWLTDRDKLIIWQQFIRLLYDHLKDVDNVDEIYFNELDFCASRLLKQNAKRLILESYVRILEHEGRLHNEFECFLCDEVISSQVSLTRAFLPAHTHCISSYAFDLSKIKYLFEYKSTLYLEDDEIEQLYQILLDGF